MTTFSSSEAIAKSIALIREIENQSDRGVAIIGVAWIEEALIEAIRAFVENHKDSWDGLFRQSGPLSSFSAKIDLARLLGMTSDVVHSDLHILRKVRNKFAHSILDRDDSALTFQSPWVRERCMAIHCVRHEELVDPRHIFR